jgi:CheY-like chemotaxis protein
MASEIALEHQEELQAILTGLLQLAGMKVDGPVTPEQVKEATEHLRSTMTELKQAASASDSGMAAPRVRKHRNILIAGQLGIILHQLRQAITKLGGEVSIAKDMEEAIAEYQKRDYSLVIIDLYMPTEREGMIVLEEIKRLSVVCQIPTQMIVLAPMSKDKSIREQCAAKGATIFLEKMEGWHQLILQYYKGEITADQIDQG